MREAHGGPRLPLGSRVLGWLLTLGLLLAGMVGTWSPQARVLAAEDPIACDPAALIAEIAAIQGAGGGTLTLATGCTYTLTAVNNVSSNGLNGLPVISTTLHIVGNGATITRSTEPGTAAFRFFELADAPDVSLTLEGVTLTNGAVIGAGRYGGAILSRGGAVTLVDSVLRGNTAGGRGGAVATLSSGAVTVTRSMLSGNTSGEWGGAIDTEKGAVTVTDSTLSGNKAAWGGAIYTEEGAVTVTGSTLSDNTADILGDAFRNDAGIVTLTGSILAQATGNLCSLGSSASVVDGGYNLATDDSCGLTAAGSLANVDPDALALGALGDNGGPTETIALGAGSVAIDRIPAAACPSATDQRGVPRPQGPGCDVGAFEVEYQAALTFDPPTPLFVDRTTRRATLTLRSTVTVDQGDAQWALPVTYTLTPLGGGPDHVCVDEDGAGVSSDTLTSTCLLPGIPAGRYTVTASVGSNYTSDPATATVVVVDPVAGFVTGGGLANGGMLSFSASYYGTTLNGAISYQRTGGDRVALSTTKLTSFVRVGDTVYVEGEASLNGVSGHRVLLTAVDHPGLQRDVVALQVWDRDGNLVESASFDLTPLQTGQVYLGAGL